MKTTRALLMLAVLLSACDRDGRATFEFIWTEGPPPKPIYLFTRVEERNESPYIGENRILASAAPVLFVPPSTPIRIESIPVGKNRVIVLEGREFPSADQPVLYYGLSKQFDAIAGEDLHVEIFIDPIATPRPPPNGEGLLIESRDGFVRTATASLVIVSDRATSVLLSNDRNFPKDRSARIALDRPAPDIEVASGFTAHRVVWDLERGLDQHCPVPGTCPREVFARAVDAQSYESVTMSSRVWLDTEPPHPREETALAGPTTPVKLTLVSTEVLRRAPAISARGAPSLAFERILPIEDSASSTYVYLLAPLSEPRPADGEYTLEASLEDLAGNVAERAEIAKLVIDSEAPSISQLDVSPPRAGPAGEVAIRFFLGEELPDANVAVAVGGHRAQCGRRGDAPAIEVACTYRMTGTEIAPGSQQSVAVTVLAFDAALNRSTLEAPIFVDFAPPELREVTVSPSIARAGALATLRLVANEPITGPARLTWSNGQDPGFTLLASGSSDIDQLFELAVSETTPPGPYTLESIELVDLVGNRATLPAGPLVFEVDNVAPVLRALTATPGRVGLAIGQEVAFDFELIESSLAGPPHVTFGADDVSASCVAVSTRWRCVHHLHGAEIAAGTESSLAVLVEVVDRAGNLARATAQVDLDFLPPSLHALSFVPESARAGDVARLYVTATEALASSFVPELTWSGADPGFVALAAAPRSFERVYELAVAPGMAAADYLLASVRLRDEAGNETLADNLTAAWTVDPNPPAISNFHITPSRVPGTAGRTIQIDFDENEAHPASMSVTIGGRDLTPSCAIIGGAIPTRSWRCTYTTTGSEYALGVEAIENVDVDLSDVAGNRSSAGGSVVFDYAPPSITSVSISPSPAGRGATAVLAIAASEPLETGFVPVLAWSRSIGFVYQPALATPLQRVFQFAVPPASTTVRTYVLNSVTLRDVAGNESTITAAPLPYSWLLDAVAPVIGPVTVNVGSAALGLPATTPPRINAAAGRSVTITFPVTEANPAANGPRVAIGSLDISAGCTVTVSGSTQTFTCTHAMSPLDPEGLHVVDVRVADSAGNTATDASATVVFDFDPPGVIAGSASINLIPGTGNRLAAVTDVKEGTRVELRFEMDEATAEPPGVVAGALTFVQQTRPGSVLLYTHTLGATSVQGTRTFTITARDLAGNSATITSLGATFNVDTIAPSDPRVATAGLIVLERRPWGDGADPTPRLTLIGGTGAVDAGATLVVSSNSDPYPEITRLLVPAGGSIPALDLDIVDVPTVRLEAIDGAGNVSAPVIVRDGVWIASINGKVPGSNTPNPHFLGVTPEARERLDQSPEGGVEREASDTEIAGVAAPGGGALSVIARPTWRLFESSTDAPSARRGHALAYDARRGRTILFGGEDAAGQLSDQTWELDGERWTQIAPLGARPSPRRNALMVYDARRECTLLVGGENATSISDEWCFDGASWRMLSASGAPYRRGAAIGYHAGRGEIVIFGGTTGPLSVLNETWVWNGVTWALQTGTAPSPRYEATMAYLPPTASGADALVLFGGRYIGVISETWSWNGSWVLNSPAVRPPALALAGMASDPDPSNLASPSPRVLLFGGDTGGSSGRSNQMWSWDGTTWQQVTTLFYTASARATPMVYDAANDRFVIFGGDDGTSTPLGGTLMWNRTRWVPPDELVGDVPSPREGHAMASSAAAGLLPPRTMMFGGDPGDSRAWFLEGTSWLAWTPSGAAPSARTGHTLAGIETGFGGGFVLFGGLIGTLRPSETWIWSPLLLSPPGAWSLHSGAGPTGRDGHTMVQVQGATRNQAFLFGGRTAPTTLSDETWTFNGGASPSWTAHPRGSGLGACLQWPSARTEQAMTYDPRRDRVVMFGGETVAGGLDNELWQWQPGGRCWTQLAPAGPWPARRKNSTMVYDANRGRVLMISGLERTTAGEDILLGDVWALTGASASPWFDSTPDPSILIPRRNATAVFDAVRERVAIFGGNDEAVGDSNRTYVLSRGKRARPAVHLSIEWLGARTTLDTLQSMSVVATSGGYGFSSSSGIGLNGALLRVWDPVAGRWFVAGSNGAVETSPGALTYSTPNADFARRLVRPVSRRIDIQIMSHGFDFGTQRAQVAVDHLELRVSYRL